MYGYGHTKLYMNMIDAINNGKKVLVDGEEGKKALEVILAIYKSHMLKKPVKLPLSNVSTTDFKEMRLKEWR